MAAFEYIALDAAGKKQKGVISADSQKAARRQLRQSALTPLKLMPTRASGEVSNSAASRGRKLKPARLVLITRQLAMLIGSGTPVEEAVAAVSKSAEDQVTRTVLASVRAGVVEGRSLSDAMRGEEKSFPRLYRSIVSAGESAGALGPVLDRLAENLEKSQSMQRKVTSAMVYPIILAVVALTVVIALMVIVVPQVVEQFDTLGQDLPAITDFMVGASRFLREFGVFILIGIALAVFSFSRAMKSESFKRRVDGFLLGLPIFGGVARSVAAARFSRTFATLAISGAPVLDSLTAARDTTPNLVLRDAVDQMTESVRKGGSLSAAMARTGVFPPLVVHMATSGEASGALGEVFDKGAEYLEEDFEAKSNMALGLLEPLITLVMGGLVLLIILAIMLPIMELNSGALLQ